MENLIFSAKINASREKVWNILWELDSYKTWTLAFAEGSTVQTDNWKEDSKVLFLDGEGRGMVSMVATNRPYEYMSFKHLGEVKDGIEDTTSEKVQAWAGSMENYILTDENGGTFLLVELDMSADFKDYFEKTWPLALAKVKELAEKH